MTRVEVRRIGDRRAAARALQRVWESGRAVWMVDPLAWPSAMESLGAGLLGPVADELETTGAASLDLDVPDDTATIVTSSGTTGPAKVLALTAPALDASADGAHAHLGLTDSDRWLLALPLHHIAGQSVVWRSRRLGHEPIVQGRLDPASARGAGATVVSLVPTQLRRFVDAGHHLDVVVLLGGGAISPSLLADAARGDHVRRVVRSYGLTETAGGCVYDGQPVDGMEVTAPDGRLRLRGPVLAAGRVTTDGLATIVDAHGWLQTNDLGTVSASGEVAVVGRADDIIITGGVKVNPGTVEVILEDHPSILRAAVLGLPDDEWGQVVVAAVTATQPIRDDMDQLTGMVRHHLGPPAVPRRIVVVPELPTTALGKVDRALVRNALT